MPEANLDRMKALLLTLLEGGGLLVWTEATSPVPAELVSLDWEPLLEQEDVALWRVTAKPEAEPDEELVESLLSQETVTQVDVDEDTETTFEDSKEENRED